METNATVKKLYISEFTGTSGICRYSSDFFDLIMKPRGFLFVSSSADIAEILSGIDSDDIIHLEIGLNRNREIEILLVLIKRNHQHLSITLHDPPRLKYPYFQFNNRLLNNLSKIADLYFDNFGINKRLFGKLKKIYVLNHLSKKILETKFGLSNAIYIPHILRQEEILTEAMVENNNFLFFGFLGRNKGIERALALHREIMIKYPDSNFYIVGSTLSTKVQKYIDKLHRKYSRNVHFLGFVPSENLTEVFKLANYVFLPFQERKFINPTSGSLLTSLKYNKIVFSNSVNAISEIIISGETGYFLPASLSESAVFILEKMNEKNELVAVKQNIARQLSLRFTKGAVNALFCEQ